MKSSVLTSLLAILLCGCCIVIVNVEGMPSTALESFNGNVARAKREGIIDEVEDAVGNVENGAESAVSSVYNTIYNYIADVISWIWNEYLNGMQYIADSLKSVTNMYEDVVQGIEDLGNDVLDPIEVLMEEFLEDTYEYVESKSPTLGFFFKLFMNAVTSNNNPGYTSQGSGEVQGSVMTVERRKRSLYDDIMALISGSPFELITIMSDALNKIYSALSDSVSACSSESSASFPKFKEFFSGPSTYIKDVICYIATHTSEAAAGEMKSMLLEIWSLMKSMVIPKLDSLAMELVDSGTLPTVLTSMLKNFDEIYKILKMFGLM